MPVIENKHTRERGHSITYELRPTLCGKPGCNKYHGPYWYAYWTAGGRVRTAYIGRKFVRVEQKCPHVLMNPGERMIFERQQKLRRRHELAREID